MWAFKTWWTHRYIENMLFWSHTDRGLKAPEKHNCISSSFSTQRRKSVGNFLSFFKCVGVHVGNFLLWGHEAEADTLHLARLSQHGQFNALYYYCIRFPLEYIRYTQVGGRGMLAMHRDAHTHTPNPKTIMSNLQVGLSIWCRKNRPAAKNNTTVIASWALKTVVKLIILRIFWHFSKLIREIYAIGGSVSCLGGL